MPQYLVKKLTDEKSIKEVEDNIFQDLSVFQSHYWLGAIGTKPISYVCYNTNEDIVGYLPLLKWKKNGLSAYHIPPYTQYYGPTILETELTKCSQVLQCLMTPLNQETHLDFKLPLDNHDLIPYLNNGFSIETSQTHIFSATDNYNLNSLTKDKKRDVSRLAKEVEMNRLIIRDNDPANLIEIVKLWEVTAERAAFNSRSKHLQNLCSSFNGFYNNLILDADGIPLAGTFCPNDLHTAYHLIGASKRSKNSLLNRANVLSLYMAVLHANRKGLNFDFEGSNTAGIASFYRMMGGKPKIIYRMQRTRSLYYNILRSAKRIRREFRGKGY